jgi:hypothetical protein
MFRKSSTGASEKEGSFSPCYRTWSLLSRIQGQSHGSSHTASLQYRFCLKICGMVPTILGCPDNPNKGVLPEWKLPGTGGYTLDRRNAELKRWPQSMVSQATTTINVTMHLVTSVLMVSSLDHPFQRSRVLSGLALPCLFRTIMHAQ